MEKQSSLDFLKTVTLTTIPVLSALGGGGTYLGYDTKIKEISVLSDKVLLEQARFDAEQKIRRD